MPAARRAVVRGGGPETVHDDLEQARGHIRRSGRGDGDAVRELEQVTDVDRRADVSGVLCGDEESATSVGQ